jgi:hypothetical protein
MRLNKILALLPVAAFLFVAGTPAQAQGGFGIGFTKFGKKSAVSVGFSTGFHGGYHRGYGHHGHVVVVDRCWVPGHYQTVARQVWVPGCVERVYVEPVYDTCVDPYGNVTRVMVRAGYYRNVEVGGRFETVYEQVWVPGYYR